MTDTATPLNQMTPDELELWWHTLSADWRYHFTQNIGLDPTDPAFFKALPTLTRFELYYNSLNGREPVTDITPLAHCTQLTSLRLTDMHIGDISPLANLVHLDSLFLMCNDISDISPLKNLTCLTYLCLHSNAILDISPLANLRTLEYLDLTDNRISDLTALAHLHDLNFLSVYHNNISDISPLGGWLIWKS
ncbi:leucine-rich repeat domain-containing protein [Moraxella lacunata]|uniref:Internalin-A n=1 Tax=Moraxella lacunata TaxID=477 RepID=A0A1V4H201_MORLA|nr:leucine-rich repeat domain-containing protein [Moraxella lacunata]OPH38406.1 hypothetical protein B5J94_03540 [Moraxella lacunata]